ncbi:MAG TPA: murein biosynthesis integral membrane protein MurJ [Firmicutes bacterium]|nr:murein biosynthesis integral membrane protein MurJ [Bacillota bacterium]
MSRKAALARASFVVAAGAVLSKCLGFLREMVIASRFGASSHVDAYVVAQGLPGLLFATVGAALGTVVIPMFTARRVSGGDEAAFRMARTIWNSVVLLALLVVVAGELATPWVIRVVAPGFTGQIFLESVVLARILMPAVLFTGVGLLARGMLNALQHFSTPAFADPAQNIIVIGSVLTLGAWLGIRGLAIGTLIGMGMQLFMLLPALVRRGFRLGVEIDWRLPELRRMWVLAIPVIIGSSVGTINALVDRMLASGLPAGNIAAMNYATRIYTLPLVFFGSAISTVLYPTMTEFAAEKSNAGMAHSIMRGLRFSAFGLLPMTAGLVVLSVPITRVVYERGAFNPQATTLTAGVMAMYALGVVAICWRDIASRAFYAMQDTITPLWTGIAAVVVNIGLNLALVRVLGARGLALATAISCWVGALLLIWSLYRRLPGFSRVAGLGLWLEIGKCGVGTVIMALGVSRMWLYLSRHIAGGLLEVIGGVVLSALIGAFIYGLCAMFLRIEDLHLARSVATGAVARIKSRLARSPARG